MKELLTTSLKSIQTLQSDDAYWQYSEDVNNDALSDAWLENSTSYIYKIGIVAAIDSNKCDWVYVAIGMQRTEHSSPIVIGTLHFKEGENDDMGRTIKRASTLLAYLHPAFEDAI